MAGAQNALPDTDIFICDVSLVKGKYYFKNLKNITNRQGYDNQPAFIDNNTILYTSIREDKQADIYKIDLITGKITQVTNTPEDEYSPTLMPDGKHISTVRVEKDSTQCLWKFPLVNPDSFSLILPDVKGVGYHCWADSLSLYLFVLGDPFTLQFVPVDPKFNDYQQAIILDYSIGRSIQKTGKNEVSYVQKSNGVPWKIAAKGIVYATSSHPVARTRNYGIKNYLNFLELPNNSEDFTYLFGHYWIANGSKLMKTIIKKRKFVWTEVFDFKGTPAENFYRIAFSPDGKKLALVSYVGKKP